MEIEETMSIIQYEDDLQIAKRIQSLTKEKKELNKEVERLENTVRWFRKFSGDMEGAYQHHVKKGTFKRQI